MPSHQLVTSAHQDKGQPNLSLVKQMPTSLTLISKEKIQIEQITGIIGWYNLALIPQTPA